MKMNISYKAKLFLYFFMVFAAFTTIVVIYHQRREQAYTKQLVEERLDLYAQVAVSDSASPLFPENLRITIISESGKVLYDNKIHNDQSIENHFSRPEIIEAKKIGYGSSIRFSESLQQVLLYYAIHIDNKYIRVALPYNDYTKSLLRSNKNSVILSIGLFLISLLFLWRIARRFGLDIEHLKRNIFEEQKAKATMKAEMTSAISHELRTPVSSIRAYTETLMEPDLSDEQKQLFIERTHTSAVRLSELLRDVSLLSKIEESNKVFQNETINLHDLIKQILESFDSGIHNNSIRIKMNIPEDLVMKGSQTLCYSLFKNLIENSIKYSGKWTTLIIRYDGEKDSFYHFTVSDNGIGVRASDLPHLFERFYRAGNNGRSREDGGSGLGLAIVRHSVLYHGGTITAENILTGGLCFRFTLRKEPEE